MRTKNNPNTNNNENKIYERNPVEVYCRIRPQKNPNESSCIINHTSTKLELTPFEDHKNKLKYQYGFKFKRIFPDDANQQEIFEEIAIPLIKNLLKAENGLLFSYGVTGSGKTYTMFGESNKPGIIPRSIHTLFNTINGSQTEKFVIKSDRMNGFEVQTKEEALEDQLKEKTKKVGMRKNKEGFLNCGRKLEENLNGLLFTVFITYVEIYNNIVYDLLEEISGSNFLQNRILREDYNKNIYVNNVHEIEVKSAEEAIEYYCMGSKRKKIAQTVLNNESSRSHSIFTIRLITQDTNLGGQFKISQLSLVDLAGSERCNRTNSSGLRLKEANWINNSLMCLRHCLDILRENEEKSIRKVIPYRESRLTHLFKNYFEGQGKVKMIICVNPSIQEHEENFHVLKFAEMTQEVKVRCEVKLPVIPEIDVKFHEYEQVEQQETFRTSSIPLNLNLNPENDHIKPLIYFLKRRKEKLTKLQTIQAKSYKFRKSLFNLQKENHMLHTQVQYYMPAEKRKAEMMKEKFQEIELKYDQMMEKCDEKENVITQLNKCLQEKDLKLNETLIEKYKQRQRLDEVSNKLKNELDIKLKHQKEYLEAQIKEKSDKLELVKDILTEQTNGWNSAKKENIPERTYSRSGIPRRKTPLSNVRCNKNCKWLEHRPAMPVPLQTVLQPKMKRKICVNGSVDKEDVLHSKRNKYVLISQNTDRKGEIETKLYKGDIIPTFSGGAQVILNDVEKLKQESPLQEN